jgi:hypothetical protein
VSPPPSPPASPPPPPSPPASPPPPPPPPPPSTLIAGRTVTHTVTFGAGYGSPLTIGAGGYIAAYGVAIYGPAGQFWTVLNLGTVAATGTPGIGIEFLSGGLVINGAIGSTSGAGMAAAAMQNWGATGNTGTVGSSSATSGATAPNGGGAGPMQAGVTNRASVASGALITAPSIAVDISGSAGTVTNYGTISGTGTSGSGVHLYAGGTVTNGADGATAALITGADSGVNITGAAGTVTNAGTITATGAYGVGVFLDLGGSVTNGAYGATAALIAGAAAGVMLFDGAGTVSNAGTLSAAGKYGAGIDLDLGGSIINGAGGETAALIAGAAGIAVYGAAATVTNYGTIAGSAGPGIYLGAGGTIANFATISGANGTAVNFAQTGGNTLVIEAGSVLGGAVANFQPGDTIDLPFLGFSGSGSVTLGSGNVLQVAEPGGSLQVDLDPAQSFAGDLFHLANDGQGGTLITEDPPGATNLALLGQFAAAGFAATAASGSGAVATYVLTHPTPSAPPVLTTPDH